MRVDCGVSVSMSLSPSPYTPHLKNLHTPHSKNLHIPHSNTLLTPHSTFHTPHSTLHYMQLVTPSVVAMAVRILMAICRIVFQVFLFMIFLI